ncbi:MAG: glycosyltransferase, partial [Armatimonadetes bacterium]|nr:glycosyltransferase [Armatimonadota bacterium]
MLDLSIVIVNWNTRDDLGRCLLSLRPAAQRLALQVVVVDNASPDGSAAIVSRRFPEVELIALRRNLGFAAANNLGLARCSGRYQMLLNPDCLVHEGALEELVAYADAHPEAGLLGPRLLNAFFMAVTPRTAGFNTTNTGSMTDNGLLLLIALMFIGGAAGSTAGGIKIQTFSLLLFAIISAVRGADDVEAFRKRIPRAGGDAPRRPQQRPATGGHDSGTPPLHVSLCAQALRAGGGGAGGAADRRPAGGRAVAA